MSELTASLFVRAIAGATPPESLEVKESARGNPYVTFKTWVNIGNDRFLVTVNAVHSVKTSGVPAGASPEQRRALLALKALRESGQSLENLD